VSDYMWNKHRKRQIFNQTHLDFNVILWTLEILLKLLYVRYCWNSGPLKLKLHFWLNESNWFWTSRGAYCLQEVHMLIVISVISYQ